MPFFDLATEADNRAGLVYGDRVLSRANGAVGE
jgi:hypothetical protein